jgi:hypothetical protein
MQWANMYEPNSPSRKLISDIMETSYLVNIVANDFKDGASIFEPFQLERVASRMTSKPNGVAAHVNGAAESQLKTAPELHQANGEATKPNGNPSPSSEPAIPTVPVPEPRKQKTMADVEDIFNSTPLFMRELPADGEENTSLEALKSLVFEGTGDGESRAFRTVPASRHCSRLTLESRRGRS